MKKMNDRSKKLIAMVIMSTLVCGYLTLCNIRFTNLDNADDLVKVADR